MQLGPPPPVHRRSCRPPPGARCPRSTSGRIPTAASSSKTAARMASVMSSRSTAAPAGARRRAVRPGPSVLVMGSIRHDATVAFRRRLGPTVTLRRYGPVPIVGYSWSVRRPGKRPGPHRRLPLQSSGCAARRSSTPPAHRHPGRRTTSRALAARARTHGQRRPAAPARSTSAGCGRGGTSSRRSPPPSFTAQYSQAKLGQVWQIMTPLLNATVYYFIFGVLLGHQTERARLHPVPGHRRVHLDVHRRARSWPAPAPSPATSGSCGRCTSRAPRCPSSFCSSSSSSCSSRWAR